MKISAKNLKGILLLSGKPPLFRIYDKKYKEGFKDFEVLNLELEIIIKDEDAHINFEKGFIDYSDATLGYENKK